MAFADEINNAIGAHGLWKTRLKHSITYTKSDFPVEQVSQDNLCEFGKWLYSCGPEEKKSAEWLAVRDLHAKFHRSAGQVLDLALQGKKKEAEEVLSGGEFAKVSGELNSALMKWKQSRAE